MNRLNRIVLLLVTAACCGCSFSEKAETTTTSASPRAFPRVAKRSYLYVDLKDTPKGYGAYAYLVFTHMPSSQDERDTAVCKAFHRDFPPAESSPSIEKRRAEMVTFWPLVGSYLGDKPNCEQLCASYAESWAADIAAAVHKQGVKGPLLIAWTKPFGDSAPASEALVLDMSSFATQDFDRAFGIWRDRISTNPEVWQQHWNIIVAREAFRNGLERYGPGIVKVVATMFHIEKPNE